MDLGATAFFSSTCLGFAAARVGLDLGTGVKDRFPLYECRVVVALLTEALPLQTGVFLPEASLAGVFLPAAALLGVFLPLTAREGVALPTAALFGVFHPDLAGVLFPALLGGDLLPVQVYFFTGMALG